ncbi:MAG: flagellar basal body-associated FliL family protein [Planctomycetota bacterium]|jgi:flagellar basal body-associated protein FliL
MPDPQETENKQDQEAQETQEKSKETEGTAKKASAGGILPWIIIAVVVIVCAGAGFGLGRLFARSGPPQTDQPQENQADPTEQLKTDTPATDTEKTWYYPLEPVVANLDEPGVTRYVRATLILEINASLDQQKTAPFLENKKPLLKNWLTIYLASLTVDDTRGDKNLKRIQSQILDAFNEKLFPDAKPQVRKILFKEFAVQ